MTNLDHRRSIVIVSEYRFDVFQERLEDLLLVASTSKRPRIDHQRLMTFGRFDDAKDETFSIGPFLEPVLETRSDWSVDHYDA